MHDITSTVLITGASGGIGYELAKLFAKHHHNLVLVARNGPKLAQFADELRREFGVETGHARSCWFNRSTAPV